METLLGFQISGWDYLTFLVIFIIGVVFLCLAVFVLGLPGRIAIARNHPEADAINVMGWAGFLAVVPWFQAFLWAFKPTTVVESILETFGGGGGGGAGHDFSIEGTNAP